MTCVNTFKALDTLTLGEDLDFGCGPNSKDKG